MCVVTSPLLFLTGRRPRGVPGAFWAWCRSEHNPLALISKIANYVFLFGILYALMTAACFAVDIARPWWINTLVGAPVFIIGCLGTSVALTSCHARFLEHLRNSDYCLCLECGYILVPSSKSVICPECGHAYDVDLLRKTWIDWRDDTLSN